MGKSIREIPAGWIENADGSYSKPKGKEILFQWDKPKADEQTPTGIVAPQSEEEKLNKTERARLEYLRMLKMPHLMIQSVTLKLAFDCRFTPDFSYIGENGRMTLEDVKGGFWREDAKIKIKVAARLFPFFRFLVVHKTKGGWNPEEIKP